MDGGAQSATCEFGDARDAFSNVVITEGKRESCVTRCAECFTGNERNFGLGEHEVGKFERGVRDRAPERASEQTRDIGETVKRPLGLKTCDPGIAESSRCISVPRRWNADRIIATSSSGRRLLQAQLVERRSPRLRLRATESLLLL